MVGNCKIPHFPRFSVSSSITLYTTLQYWLSTFTMLESKKKKRNLVQREPKHTPMSFPVPNITSANIFSLVFWAQQVYLANHLSSTLSVHTFLGTGHTAHCLAHGTEHSLVHSTFFGTLGTAHSWQRLYGWEYILCHTKNMFPSLTTYSLTVIQQNLYHNTHD